MRELKFRAWHKERKVMQGDAEACPDDSWGGDSFGYNVCLNSIVKLAQDQNQILMQYTGLKDKNGKEIYEGDIINYKLEGWQHSKLSIDKNVNVVWGKYGFVLDTDDPYIKINHEECFNAEISIEVIGNIHEKEQRND